MMKLEAISALAVESVKDALREIGIEGMTVTEVRGTAGRRDTRRSTGT